MMILLFFAVITLVLLVKLNSILGTRVGFHIPEEMIPKMDKEASEEVAIAEIDRKILDIKKHYPSFEEDSFLKKAEIAFETIFNAYAKEDLATLESLLSPRLFHAFSLAINDRKSRGETLEGTLIRCIKKEIIDASTSDDRIFVEVKFSTEQSNVLKSSSGEILEGSEEFIKVHTDIWVFSRLKDEKTSRWYLYEIKYEAN